MLGLGLSLPPALRQNAWWLLGGYRAPDGGLPAALADFNRQRFALPALGPELVPAEGLGNPALWGAGTGWSLSGGVATKSAGTGAYLQLLGFTPTPGKTYQITTVVATRTAGAMQVTLGGVDGGGRAAAGTYVEYTTAATEDFITTSGLAIYGNSTFAGSVSSISVREVLLGDVGVNLAASGYTMSTSGTGATSVESPAGRLTLTPAASGTARADFQLTGLTVGACYLIGSTTETNAASIAVGTSQGLGDVMVATTAVGVSSIFMFTATATTQWLRFSRGNTTGAAVVSRIYVAQFSARPTLRAATFAEAFAYTCSSTTARTYIDSAGVMRNDLAIDQPRWDWSTGKRRLLLECQSTNLVLNSATLSTQSITVTAVPHTLSFTGTGTVTLSGASTAGPLVGTGASNRVTLTFTPSAGSLTLTVAGSVTLAQCEPQAFASSYIPTAAATVTRQVESAKLSPLAQAVVSRAACTIAVRGRLTNTSTASRALFGNDGSGTLLFAANASQTVVSNWNGASGILGTLGSGAFNTSAFGAVLAFDSGGRVVAANGGAIASDTAAVGNRAVTYLGRSPGSATWGDGFYDNFVLYAARVSNAAVPALAVAA